MTRGNSHSASRRPSPRKYPREARLGELVHRVVAEELERFDDEPLEMVTVTDVVCDPDLHWAVVYFTSLRGPDADEEIIGALEFRRSRLQRAIATQVRAKRTPELRFEADKVARSAARIEQILRDTPLVGRDNDEPTPDDTAGESGSDVGNDVVEDH